MGDSAADGLAEKSVDRIKGLVKTMRDALEVRLGQQINGPTLAFLVEHAAATLNRYVRNEDGRIPEEVRRGCRTRLPGHDLGSK